MTCVIDQPQPWSCGETCSTLTIFLKLQDSTPVRATWFTPQTLMAGWQDGPGVPDKRIQGNQSSLLGSVNRLTVCLWWAIIA